jgi:outer membrane protein assembly factor BamB
MTNSLRHHCRGTAALLLGAAALLGTHGVMVRADDSPELRGSVTRRGVYNEKISTPLSLLWRFSAGAQAPNYSSPAVVGNTAYFAARGTGEGGVLYAVDTQTGARRWQFPTDPNGLRDRNVFLTSPLVYQDRVYIGAGDGYMYVLDAKTGNQQFRIRTARSITSSPTVVDDVLYFGSNDGVLYAVNPNTGEPIWKPLYNAGNSINSAPVIANGLIFVTTNDNTLHAAVQANGRFRWKQHFPYRVEADSIVFADNTLYVPGGPKLYALQPTSGLARWERSLDDDIVAPPVADNGIVYVMTRDPKGDGSILHAIRSNNGHDYWAKPITLPLAPAAAPTLTGDVLFIPTNDNVILAVSREDGKLLWGYYMKPSSNRPSAADAATGARTGGFPGGGAPGGFPGGGFPGGGAPGGGGGATAGRGQGQGGRGGGRGQQRRRSPNAVDTSVSITAPIVVSGGTIFAVADDGSLSAFRADAPDTTGPEFSGLYPPPGRAINGQPPVTLAASITDIGTGLNPGALVVKLDDKPVSALYDPDRNLVVYTTKASGKIVDQPLPDGRHTVSIVAQDWRGNKSENTWSFIVNNTLPPPAKRAAPTVSRAAQRNPGQGNVPPPPPGGEDTAPPPDAPPLE